MQLYYMPSYTSLVVLYYMQLCFLVLICKLVIGEKFIDE